MPVRRIAGSQIAEVTKEKEALSLIDFGATWCGPCKMIEPVLEKVSESMEGKVSFYSVDVDESQAESSRFGIRGVPTLIVFHDGEEIDRMVGFRDKGDLESHLEGLVSKHLG